ncbi:hypothetical protein V8G54_023483 [Vigna mungo]|uniref:Secreted protein n=1 Tax=Vigna mungo TaxID=3915 RepID=A0AAQ3N566_VIGMU
MKNMSLVVMVLLVVASIGFEKEGPLRVEARMCEMALTDPPKRRTCSFSWCFQACMNEHPDKSAQGKCVGPICKREEEAPSSWTETLLSTPGFTLYSLNTCSSSGISSVKHITRTHHFPTYILLHYTTHQENKMFIISLSILTTRIHLTTIARVHSVQDLPSTPTITGRGQETHRQSKREPKAFSLVVIREPPIHPSRACKSIG